MNSLTPCPIHRWCDGAHDSIPATCHEGPEVHVLTSSDVNYGLEGEVSARIHEIVGRPVRVRLSLGYALGDLSRDQALELAAVLTELAERADQ